MISTQISRSCVSIHRRVSTMRTIAQCPEHFKTGVIHEDDALAEPVQKKLRSEEYIDDGDFITKPIVQILYRNGPPVDIVIVPTDSESSNYDGAVTYGSSGCGRQDRGGRLHRSAKSSTIETASRLSTMRSVKPEVDIPEQHTDARNETITGTVLVHRHIQVTVSPMEFTHMMFTEQTWKVAAFDNVGYAMIAENNATTPVYISLTVLENDEVVSTRRIPLLPAQGCRWPAYGPLAGPGRVIRVTFGEDHVSQCIATMVVDISA